MDINGTAALVTGGASGLGLATAERLAAAGAQVTILDLPSSQGKVVADRLGPAVSFAPADVTDPAAVGAALSGIARRGCWSTAPALASQNASSAVTARWRSPISTR